MSNAPGVPPANRPVDRGQPRPPMSTARFVWWMTLGTCALLFITDLPNEFVRWRHAAAQVARSTGDKAQAYAILENAYRGQTNNIDFQQTLIAWRAADGEPEVALLLLDKLLDANPNRTELLQYRGNLYLELKRFPKAIADCLEVERISKSTGTPSRSEALNHLAYARGLAGQDLEQAERDVDVSVQNAQAAFDKAEAAWHGSQKTGWSLTSNGLKVANAQQSLASYLDTRGYVRFKLGELEAAKSDLDEAIRRMEESFRIGRMYLHESPQAERYFRDFVAKRMRENRVTAVLYYHRYLIHQELNDEQAAKRDFRQARDLLGKDPDESLF